VGVPSENPNLTERGLVITDFVDRVGDPIALLAPDGSSHRAEDLLADALRAMVHTVAPQEPEPVGVSYPAHWRPVTVEALRGALSTMSEFRAPNPVLLTSDAVAALTALQQDPGVPAQGVIALCDFGGRGTSITLADAARDFVPIAPTERHLDLSGDLIDQALLTHVIGELSSAGSVDLTSTSAIGSLTRLRAQCRSAKERLSTAAVTALTADLPGHSGEIRMTRTELDDVIRQPLAGFIAVLQELLQRSGVRPSELVAVATVGGGARMPVVTTTLSDVLQVPVITAAHPELAAAIGAGLRAVRGTLVEGATAMAPAVAGAATGLAPAVTSAPEGPVGALAWSDTDDADDADDDIPDGDIPYVAPPLDESAADGWDGDSARPQIEFAAAEEPEDEPAPWYRSPSVLVAAVLLAVLAAIGVVAVFLLGGEDEPASTITTTTTPTATSSASPVPVSEPPPAETPAQVPPSEPANVNPAPPAATVTQEAPPPPAPTEPPPPSEPPPTEAPPPPASEEPPPSSNPPPLIPTLPYETIPGLPFVPSPFQPPQP
jgi:hypothetical protein